MYCRYLRVVDRIVSVTHDHTKNVHNRSISCVKNCAHKVTDYCHKYTKYCDTELSKTYVHINILVKSTSQLSGGLVITDHCSPYLVLVMELILYCMW